MSYDYRTENTYFKRTREKKAYHVAKFRYDRVKLNDPIKQHIKIKCISLRNLVFQHFDKSSIDYNSVESNN